MGGRPSRRGERGGHLPPFVSARHFQAVYKERERMCDEAAARCYSIVDSMFGKLMDVMADRGEVMDALAFHRGNARMAFVSNALQMGRIDNHPMFQEMQMGDIMEMIVAQKAELERMILENKESDTFTLVLDMMDGLFKAVNDRQSVLDILMFGLDC